MKLFACALMLTVAATDGPPPLTLDHGPKRICIRGGVNDGACFVRVAESAVIDVPRAVQNFDRAYDDHNQPRDPTQRFTPGEVRSMAAAAPLNGELRRRVREGFRTLRISEVAVDPMAIITIDRGRDVAFVATITWAARDDARAEVITPVRGRVRVVRDALARLSTLTLNDPAALHRLASELVVIDEVAPGAPSAPDLAELIVPAVLAAVYFNGVLRDDPSETPAPGPALP